MKFGRVTYDARPQGSEKVAVHTYWIVGEPWRPGDFGFSSREVHRQRYYRLLPGFHPVLPRKGTRPDGYKLQSAFFVSIHEDTTSGLMGMAG